MALDPREVLAIKTLFDAGAHTKALAMAFGHDQRTIRKALRRWTRRPLQEPPLYTQWRQGLSPETLAAIKKHFEQLAVQEQTMFHALSTVAQDTDDDLALPSEDAYAEVLRTAHPRESVVELAQRLHIDLTVVLLAYAEWREQTEYLQWTVLSGRKKP